MDDKLKKTPIVEDSKAKPQEVGGLDEALSQLEADVALDATHDSWWSILRFWIQELRWRRAFWKKMGHPSMEDCES